MKFKLKPKIKINKKELIKNHNIDFKKLDLQSNLETNLDKNVVLNLSSTIDSNYQTNVNLKDRIKSFSFKFTTRF